MHSLKLKRDPTAVLEHNDNSRPHRAEDNNGEPGVRSKIGGYNDSWPTLSPSEDVDVDVRNIRVYWQGASPGWLLRKDKTKLRTNL